MRRVEYRGRTLQDGKKIKFVIGLGNPGLEYHNTRHNIGFMVLKELRSRRNLGRAKRKFLAKCWRGIVNDNEVFLIEPQTYMNRSGESVRLLVNFYRPNFSDIIIIMDDMALPIGQIRIRASGSAGGHKGLGNIIEMLNTDKITRLRVGIGQPPEGIDPIDYVLGKFNKEEKIIVSKSIKLAADAVEDWIRNGTTYVMNHYNNRKIEIN